MRFEEAPRKKRVVVIDGEVIGAPSSSGFGAFNAMSAGERVFLAGKMNATVAAIRSAFKIAHVKVAATPNALVGGVLAVLTLGLSTLGIQSAPTETKKGVDDGLLTLERMFESQVVAAMPRVYNGELTADRWFSMAQLYVTGIKSILDELRDSGTGASLQAVFDGMFGDTKAFLAKFKAGVENTFDYMPVIVGGAALLATYLVVTRFLPQQKTLSGYHRRRRRLR